MPVRERRSLGRAARDDERANAIAIAVCAAQSRARPTFTIAAPRAYACTEVFLRKQRVYAARGRRGARTAVSRASHEILLRHATGGFHGLRRARTTTQR